MKDKMEQGNISEYTVIYSRNSGLIIELVNAEIKKGWIPIGGISCVKGEYMQAMINYGKFTRTWNSSAGKFE